MKPGVVYEVGSGSSTATTGDINISNIMALRMKQPIVDAASYLDTSKENVKISHYANEKKNKDLRRFCLLYGNTSDIGYNPNYKSINNVNVGEETVSEWFWKDALVPYALNNPTKFIDLYTIDKICMENHNKCIANDNNYEGLYREYDEWNANKWNIPDSNFHFFLDLKYNDINTNFQSKGLFWPKNCSNNYIMFPRQQTFTDDTFVTSSFLWNIMNPNKVEPKMDAEFPYVKDNYVQITDPDAVYFFNRQYTDNHKYMYENIKITGFTNQFKLFGDNLKHIHNLLYFDNKYFAIRLYGDLQYRKQAAGMRIFTDNGTCTFGVINNCVTDALGWIGFYGTTKTPPFITGNFDENATNSGSYAFFQPDTSHTLEWYNNVFKTYGNYDTNIINQNVVNKIEEILLPFQKNHLHYFMYHGDDGNKWLECCGTHYNEEYRVYWYK